MSFKDFEERAADPAVAKQRAEEDRIRRAEEQDRLRRAAELEEVEEREKRHRRSKGIMPWLEALGWSLGIGFCGGLMFGFYADGDSWTVPSGRPVEAFGDVMLLIFKALTAIAVPLFAIVVPWFAVYEMGDPDKPLFTGVKKAIFISCCYVTIAAFCYLGYEVFHILDI